MMKIYCLEKKPMPKELFSNAFMRSAVPIILITQIIEIMASHLAWPAQMVPLTNAQKKWQALFAER